MISKLKKRKRRKEEMKDTTKDILKEKYSMACPPEKGHGGGVGEHLLSNHIANKKREGRVGFQYLSSLSTP